jgi:translation initiation factor 1A
MWIRDHDVVLVADILWRYIAAHADKLEQDGYLTNLGHMVVVG